jgi:amino acid adenylation domain-containing protein
MTVSETTDRRTAELAANVGTATPPRWTLDNSVFAVRLDGRLDVPALVAALPVPAQLTDLRHLDGERYAALHRAAGELARRPFAPDEPPFRAALFTLAEDRHALVVVGHPAHADAASLVGSLDGALVVESPSENDGYWAETLDGAAPDVVLPADRPRILRTRRSAVLPVALAPRERAALAALCAATGADPPTVLVAAFAALLMRYGTQNDVLLGWPVNGTARTLLPLRVRGSGPLTDLVAATGAAMRGALAHAGDRAALAVQLDRVLPDGDDSGAVLPAGVSIAPAAHRRLRLPGIDVTELADVTPNTRLELELQVRTDGDDTTLALAYSTEVFDQSTVERVAAHLRELLHAAAAAPATRVPVLPILPTTERAAVLRHGNDTERPFPADATVPDLFERRAAAHPGAPAVVDGDRRLTYAELDRAANRLAHRLSESGAGAESTVGVLVERGADAIVAFLGVLKAGAAYVPLDPAQPADRLAAIARDAGFAALVTHRGLDARLAAHTVVRLDEPVDGPDHPPARRIGPDNLAYVIYTSGSTGTPKGVAVAHRGAVNLATWQGRTFDITDRDTVALFSSLDFDASVWELLMALANGAGLAVVHPKAMSATEVAAEMAARGVTIATLPPAFLRTLGGGELPGVRVLVSAGEACTPDLDRTWSPGRMFVNAYGPTETTVCATTARCDGRSAAVPIGLPLDNVRAYVLDGRLEPVPLGVPGELYVGGVALARGYRNQPGRTAAAFVPDPFGPAGSRLYRTGDLVRRDPAGQLHFAGRTDHQVKIRGFRIETGEVESVLSRHPDVRDVVVLVEHETGQEPRLVAAVVLTPDAHAVATRGTGQQRWQGRSLHHELAEFAGAALPSYMLPARYVAVAALPLTPHGKVDRDALLELTHQPVDEPAAPSDEPATPTEQTVAAIWAKHLGLARVSRHDHFLEIGGHSLVAVRVIEELRETFATDLPIGALFSSPVLADLAAELDARPAGG